MPKYRVTVCRTAYAHLDIEVHAKNLKEAKRKALDEAGGHQFSEHTSEYSEEGISRIE
jgi:hypothetical protein